MRTRRRRSGSRAGAVTAPALSTARLLPRRPWTEASRSGRSPAPFEEPAGDVPVLQAGEGFLRQGSEHEPPRTAPALSGHLAGPAVAMETAPLRRGARPRSQAFRRP